MVLLGKLSQFLYVPSWRITLHLMLLDQWVRFYDLLDIFSNRLVLLFGDFVVFNFMLTTSNSYYMKCSLNFDDALIQVLLSILLFSLYINSVFVGSITHNVLYLTLQLFFYIRVMTSSSTCTNVISYILCILGLMNQSLFYCLIFMNNIYYLYTLYEYGFSLHM